VTAFCTTLYINLKTSVFCNLLQSNFAQTDSFVRGDLLFISQAGLVVNMASASVGTWSCIGCCRQTLNGWHLTRQCRYATYELRRPHTAQLMCGQTADR